MPSTSCRGHPDLLVYYGAGKLEALVGYRRVVLQPNHYAAEEVRRLAAAGTQPLAYLAVGEDTGPPAPWQLGDRNPIWGGHYVDVGHPGWLAHLRAEARAALTHGFTGLLLDTLETPPILSHGRAALASLVGELRGVVGDGYMVANRGHHLRRLLTPHVDAYLLESFSTTWEEGYRALPGRGLSDSAARLRELRATGRDVYALDYADRPELADFAEERATNLGVRVQVSNRDLTCIPEAA